jgi:Ser/Thr protein kinase RdoA (MazF antagonist)
MYNHEFDYEQQPTRQGLLDISEIMQAFGIAEWKNLGPMVSSHEENLSLLVEVQGHRYVLKERAEGPAGENLNHRYNFQRYLQQNGIPIPPLWLTPQGEPMVTVDEDSFELQQWAGGEQFSTADTRNLDWVGYAGTMLGRIHQASLHYPGPEHHWPSEVHIGALVQGWLNLARAKADESEIQAIAAALSHWVDQWEAVLPSAMMSIGAAHNLPTFHIHGDYHAHNLRFGSFGVTAVMGFEASRWEKRIFEVATGLFSFSALAWQTDSDLTRPLVKRGFEPERARQFLQSYGEVFPPVRGEAALLADALMLICPIATINGPFEDLFYTQEGMDDALIDDVMERLSWASSLPGWLRRVRGSLAEMWE